MNPDVQALISGVTTGSLLALLTFGVVLIYKATNVLNLAHGQVATLASFIGAIYLDPAVYPLWCIPLIMMAVGAGTSLTIEQAVIKPLRRAPLWNVVLATLAIGLVIQALTGVAWGYEDHFFPYAFGIGVFHVGGYVITRQELVIVLITAFLLLVSTWFFTSTRSGIALRAIAGNRVGADIVGSRTRLLQSASWAIGGAIAGLTGFLAAPIIFVHPGMMETFLLDALAAATLAGLGSLPGAVAGAIVIGIATELANLHMPVEFRAMLPLMIIFLALLARPQGIARTAERTV